VVLIEHDEPLGRLLPEAVGEAVERAEALVEPSRSPVSRTWSSWWKPSDHCASCPHSSIGRKSSRHISEITSARGFSARTRSASSASTCCGESS
jgi:hypothetical protein